MILEREMSTRLVLQPGNFAPVDHLRRVKLHFILQEHQVIIQQCVQCVDRQEISRLRCCCRAALAKLKK